MVKLEILGYEFGDVLLQLDGKDFAVPFINFIAWLKMYSYSEFLLLADLFCEAPYPLFLYGIKSGEFKGLQFHFDSWPLGRSNRIGDSFHYDGVIALGHLVTSEHIWVEFVGLGRTAEMLKKHFMQLVKVNISPINLSASQLMSIDRISRAA